MGNFDFSQIARTVRYCDVQEVLNVLNSQKMKFWSWGSSNFVNVENKALRFRTRAHRHNGYVYIVVNGLDLYDVYLVTFKGNIKKKLSDIYAEDLVNIIDDEIERMDYYRD